MGSKKPKRRPRQNTAQRKKTAQRFTIGGILIAAVTWFGAQILTPTLKDRFGSLIPSLEREVIQASLSIQPYDMLSGRISAPVTLNSSVEGELPEVERTLKETSAPEIENAVAGEMTMDVKLELSDFTLRASAPLTLVVNEPGQMGQVTPGTRPLSSDGADLYNLFDSGNFYDHDCTCIHLALRDEAGRFSGGPDRIYLVEEKASFSPERLETSVNATLHRDRITIAVFIETPGASAEVGERVKATLHQTLAQSLEPRDPIVVSPFRTMEELEKEQQRLLQIPPSPDKSKRVVDANVDQIVTVIARVHTTGPFGYRWDEPS